MANKERLREVRDFLRSHPLLLDMNTWVTGNPDDAAISEGRYGECGTTACLAGWTALLNGWRPGQRALGRMVSPDQSEEDHAGSVAGWILELSPVEEEELFYSSKEEVFEVIEAILNDTFKTRKLMWMSRGV